MNNRLHEEFIPEEIIEEVRLRTDIIEVISEYVSLQRKGNNYWGICPFHSEKTPSFSVSAEKQMFYCFGCNSGGNAFSFVMKKENWSFVESVQNFASRYGVALPEKSLSPQEREENRLRRRWEEIHEWATSYYQDILVRLPEGEPGRVYFAKREVDLDTINRFRLGYAPERWDGLITYMQERGVQPHELVGAGLALEKVTSGKVSRYYDRFRNRVLFSILDRRYHTIAFGGRVLDDSLPKYLNSPESTFYNKGHHLYGMHRAHQGIREEGYALLVEGYMDVIALQNAGFPNAVASLGTALTRNQATLLKRYAQRVVLLYDSDEAGVQAALRGGEILCDVGIRVDVLTLSGAKDPDEFLKSYGLEEFKRSLSRALTYVEFKYRTFVQNKLPQTIPEKAEIVMKLAPDILRVNSPVEREGYERFLSLELGLTLEAVQREIVSQEPKKAKKEREHEYSQQKQVSSGKNRDNIKGTIIGKGNIEQPQPTVYLAGYRAERMLLRLLLENKAHLPRIKERLGESFWKLPAHQQIFKYLNQDGVLPAHSDETVQSCLASLLLEELDISQTERLLEDCIKGILSTQVVERVEDLQARMATLEKSGDMAGAMALLKEIGERLKRGE
ncbi:DNA primase [Desulfosporosinus sp. BICA1-9]|uniref:DNA primase n=1 Tax=Desulfosporosinus sp. BICA1-9 TaxID=1531958 RepID=UPI0005F196B6|nr:DNA primase [Desulfosporosinus sp. BICA1-9]KJS86794.1 MAG: DNA primase [Desulfosporosinus sp. BICA1-9]HBW37842.1 DNA primase [Desulfosporosinus sp.]